LFAPDAETIIDQVSFPPMATGESFGRIPDGGSDLRKLFVTTPGASNQDSIPPLWQAGVESRDGQLSAYPNPSNDFVNIVKVGEPMIGQCTLEAFDVNGRRVDLSASEMRKGKAWILNRSNLSDGLYLIVLRSENAVHRIQIVLN
jgi:hypothetical protein